VVLQESRQRLVEPPDVQFDVGFDDGHALAGERAGIERPTGPWLREALEGVEPVDRRDSMTTGDLVDRPTGSHTELQEQAIDADAPAGEGEDVGGVAPHQRVGHVGLDVVHRLVERVLQQRVVGMPAVGVVPAPVVGGAGRADGAGEHAMRPPLDGVDRSAEQVAGRSRSRHPAECRWRHGRQTGRPDDRTM
jgi:hypothetical protein